MNVLRFAWNCCQRCGEPLEMDAPAFGRAVGLEVVLDPSGAAVAYVYEHIEDCPKDLAGPA